MEEKTKTFWAIVFSVIIIIAFIIVSYYTAIHRVDEYKKYIMEIETVDYIVKQGDTFWEIAEEYGCENEDPRIYVYKLEILNDINPCELKPGQTIKIIKEGDTNV